MNSPTILVVDGDPGTRMGLSALLEAHGARVVVADTAEHAAASATETRPDLIILEQTLPGGNGSDLCSRWAADPALSGTPILFMHAEEDGRPEPEVGADTMPAGFIAKPIDPTALILGVEALLATDRRPRESRGGGGTSLAPSLVAVAVLASDTSVMEANAALGDLLGYATGELPGTRWNDLTAEADRSKNADLFGPSDHHEDPVAGHLLHKDGHSVSVSITAMPFPRQGDRIGTVLVVTAPGAQRAPVASPEPTRSEDGDAKKEVEQLHNQLMQSDKLASIGQLTAGVAHEINNPIGFISSNLNSLGEYAEDLGQVLTAYEKLLGECLAEGSSSNATAQEVDRLKREVDIEFIMSDLANLLKESTEGAQRVRQIVADLRDFAHADTPDTSEEDIHALIDKTINVAWNELKYKTEVVKEYGEVPAISCFAGRLGQVFLNLLVNAAHAIDERGTITIRTGHEGANAWIEVSDTGSGIPEENRARIFDAFFTTKPLGKGTGLGLNLAHEIVTAHGGTITCESTVGTGTTFHIELPIAGPPEDQESDKAESSA